MVSMARRSCGPGFRQQSGCGQGHRIINPCGCNQPGLSGPPFCRQRSPSCLVKPGPVTRPCWRQCPAGAKSASAVVVGATSPPGLCHRNRPTRPDVTLFDATSESPGGQDSAPKQVPGKEEFVETLRLPATNAQTDWCDGQIGQRVGADDPGEGGIRDVVLGLPASVLVLPRSGHRAGVLGYLDVLRDKSRWVKTVARDRRWYPYFGCLEYLLVEGRARAWTRPGFSGSGASFTTGAARGDRSGASTRCRKIYLLQQRPAKWATAWKTTGWIHRTGLKKPRRRNDSGRELPQDRRRWPTHPCGRQAMNCPWTTSSSAPARAQPELRLPWRPAACGKT